MRTIQLARERRDPISDPKTGRRVEAGKAIAAEIDRYTDVYYPALQDRLPLRAGGLEDQPARYLEVIGLIRDMEARVESKLLDIMKERTANE